MLDANLTIALVAVFTSVALFASSITNLVLDRISLAPVRRRLEASARPRAKLLEMPALASFDETSAETLKRLSRYLPKSPEAIGRLRWQLTMARYSHPSHLVIYSICEFAAAAIGFLLPIAYLGPSVVGWLYAGIGGLLGYLIPGFVVDRRVRARQRAIQNGLPDTLDLLIVCLEAGLSLDQALIKCADELQISHPLLAEELRTINVECRAGKPRIEAFKNFAKRTRVDDVRALVAMLVQTDRFGTSVAQALRTHSDVSRTKRRQRAEEAAAKLGIKLVFPLVLCLFPAFYVVILGPAVIKFAEAFGNGGMLPNFGQ